MTTADIANKTSAPEKILLAAHGLGESFSAETLVVAAWQRHPDVFALNEHPEYPDSNKVLACLMGKRGLVSRGWFSRVGSRRYSMTRQGREQVRSLMPGYVTAEPDLPSHLSQLLHDLTSSDAWLKRDRRQELNFADACRFWGIHDHAERNLDEALGDIRQGLESLGEYGAADVAGLVALETHLRQRFKRHLTLLRMHLAKEVAV